LLLIVAVALLLNGFLQVQVSRQQRDILAAHEQQMERWAEAVSYIARWQGPTQMRTACELDSKAVDMTFQEARGVADVEILVNRTRDGLQRLAALKGP
jgi:hypothetical protein